MPPLKIGLLGAAGRMGQSLALEIARDSGLVLAAAGEHKEHNVTGSLLASHTGEVQAIRITAQAEVVFELSEVVLDFSHASVARDHACLAAETGTPILIGTTGLSQHDEAKIAEFASRTAILRTRNTSQGITLLALAAKEIARGLGDGYEVKIHDLHHRHKRDSPSGTALLLAEALGEAGKSVTFSSAREGEVVGEHQIFFSSAEEEIELLHRAKNRRLFALGALCGARWLKGRKAGLYSMEDVFRP